MEGGGAKGGGAAGGTSGGARGGANKVRCPGPRRSRGACGLSAEGRQRDAEIRLFAEARASRNDLAMLAQGSEGTVGAIAYKDGRAAPSWLLEQIAKACKDGMPCRRREHMAQPSELDRHVPLVMAPVRREPLHATWVRLAQDEGLVGQWSAVVADGQRLTRSRAAPH